MLKVFLLALNFFVEGILVDLCPYNGGMAEKMSDDKRNQLRFNLHLLRGRM